MDTAALLAQLSTLVVKDHVALGCLAFPAQRQALALVWAGLPQGTAWTERAVNEVLKAQLSGPLQCLGTDHVELRRWLVDGGWLQRDGFGREYRATPVQALLPELQGMAQALAGIDTAHWVAQRRGEMDARRLARRQAWEESQKAA